MGRFANLTNYKRDIGKLFMGNDEIVKCLINNNKNFLTSSIPSDYQRGDLMYSQIYPYIKIPDIKEKEKTLITMNFQFKPKGSAFILGAINFYVITHTNIIETDEGQRTDFLIDKIDEIFHLSQIIGVTKMMFDGMGDFPVDSEGKWVGHSISYKSTDT